MISPYPENKTLKILVLLVMMTGALQAQEVRSYAANKNNPTAYHTRKVDAAIVIRVRFEKRVILSWLPFRGAVSHYVLERSVDGRHFDEAGVFFTSDTGEEPVYTHTDQFSRAYAGPLYYRLHVVGLDGSEVYTQSTLTEGTR